jgi:hypothetical protein
MRAGLLVGQASGIGNLNARVEAVSKSLASNSDSLDKVDAQWASTLGLSDWPGIRTEPKALSDSSATAEAHQAVIDKLRSLIADAGDKSNLILDPDLDSFYLMDTVIVCLPDTLMHLSDLQMRALRAIGSGK